MDGRIYTDDGSLESSYSKAETTLNYDYRVDYKESYEKQKFFNNSNNTSSDSDTQEVLYSAFEEFFINDDLIMTLTNLL